MGACYTSRKIFALGHQQSDHYQRIHVTPKEFITALNAIDLDVQLDGDLVTTVTRRIYKETGRRGNYKTFAFVPRTQVIPEGADYIPLHLMDNQSLDERAKLITRFWTERYNMPGRYL